MACKRSWVRIPLSPFVTGKASVKSRGLFCYIGNSFGVSYVTKSLPGRIALRRSGMMPPKRPAAGGESCDAGFFLHRKLLWSLLCNKPTGRIALRRSGMMPPKRPAAGGDVCNRTSFFMFRGKCTKTEDRICELCAHFFDTLCYYNRRNPPIHYIVFATPH